jgi:hypothetical protein
MEMVEDKLALLEIQKQSEDDGQKILDELSQMIKSAIVSTIESANSTESIDDRINILVTGFQSVLGSVNEYRSNFLRSQHTLKTKISVLEEVLDSYIQTKNN